MICPRCGSPEAEDAVYCSNCGASLGPPSTAQNATAAAGPAADETTRIAEPLTPPPPPPSEPHQGAYARAAASRLPPPSRDPSEQPFLSSLFDISFRSFITPKVITVVYVLIMIVLGLGAIAFIFGAFLFNKALGIVSLVILAPLYFFLSLMLWRIALEILAVIFRIADDLHAIRVREDLGSTIGRASPGPPTLLR